MNPTTFPEVNIRYSAPTGIDESQVMTIPAFVGETKSGSMDGVPMVVVAWLPTAEERSKIALGLPIFLTFIGGIPPHYPSMSFEEATHPV